MERKARDGKAAPLAGPLLRWYRWARRDLPWRKKPTPYRVWISEMMLQQTRMEVALPRYQRFLERFPDLEALASASEEEVLAEWSGLGYYSRARSLHAAARKIIAQHDGEFPRDLDAARALPGVGPYTAGAVLSIAYNLPVPVLDGNVARVLTRLSRIGGDPRQGATRSTLQSLAGRLLPEGQASRFNQALMELGALICLPTAPRCEACPLRELCQARRRGDQARYPEKIAARPTEPVFLSAAVLQEGRKYFLERRPPDAPYLRGMWGFPTVEVRPARGPASLLKYLQKRWGIDAKPRALIGTFSHSITYRRITLHAIRFQSDRRRPKARDGASGSEGGWFPLISLGTRLPASSLYLKVQRVLLDHEK